MNTKIIKGCGWGVLAIVLLFAIIAALASPIAKHIVNSKGEDIIGRQMHAEHVRVNIFTGSVTITEFQCFEPNGQTNFAYFDRLYVKIAYPRLIGNYLKIKHFHLEGFNAQVLQTKDKLNFSDIIERFSKDDDEDEETKPWRVYIGDIQLSNSSFFYRDVLHDKEWQLENISLAIPGLDFDNEDTHAGLDFTLPTGGQVVVEAKYLAPANSIRMIFNLHDVHSDVILPLVQDYYNVSDLGAKINGQLRLMLRLDDIQDLEVRGNLVADDVRIRDSYRNEVLSLEELRIALNNGNIGSRTFILDSLILQGLTGNYEVHDDWTTLSRLVKSDEAKEAAKNARKKNKKAQPTKSASKPIVWTARTAILTGHDITYTDHSMKYNWSYGIKTIQANGQHISSRGRSNLRINATLTNNAKLKADFTGGLNVQRQDTKFNATVSNVRLKDFDKWCRNYTGYPIQGGILFAEMHMDFTSGKLTGNTRVVIDEPVIDKKEKLTKAPYRNLPVRSTFTKLVDSDDRVVINAPVSADATKKNFSFSKVVTKSLIKETFGRTMQTKSMKDKISEEEREAIEALIGDDSEDKREVRKEQREIKKEQRESARDKRRNDRKKKR